ncbi:GAF domain-containing sensor histidine kinase [Spirosoma pollinicola]|uniref:histidine kinase n=1 Tax=Spirosoma pollinicola TaxID=2057025 RepID=A0A2K8Z331_9BACT|nr:ATP-binding protein [Spirosoma pollinicola]AUD04234.1 histidine kinase [Spirosoma pollinicola]
MSTVNVDFAKDIERVNKIPLITTLLDVVCQVTGMGFAALARVTEDRWIACSVRDDIQFGLIPGGELKVETTICNEIRDSHQAIVIDHVRESDTFCKHPTPLMYGFQSYISFPIILKTGGFFGTLCAIDPRPAQLENPKIIGMFRLFTDLISFHLQQIELLEQSQLEVAEKELARQQVEKSESQYRNLSDTLEQQVQERTRQLQETIYDLQRSNANLQQFAYIASHDLQEPLRKIQSFGDLLQAQHAVELGKGADLVVRMQTAARRMSGLIKDLLTFSRISTRQEATSSVPLNQVINTALQDLEIPIREAGAHIEIDLLPVVHGDFGQLGQLFQNLLSNALKFRQQDVPTHIQIRAQITPATALPASVKPARKVAMYHRIEVTDNGIGFDSKYLDRVFQVFQRLHSRSEFSGTGIGLAICEKVAINHGGAITAISQPGLGATFQVYLPTIDEPISL